MPKVTVWAPRAHKVELEIGGQRLDMAPGADGEWHLDTPLAQHGTDYAFVLKPLCDLAPDEVHPVLGKSYRQMWEEFEPKPRMRRVEL